MKKILILIACLNLIVVVGSQKSATADSHQIHNQWHQWRGPDATGVAPHATPPTEWNENKNIRWKKISKVFQDSVNHLLWQT